MVSKQDFGSFRMYAKTLASTLRSYGHAILAINAIRKAGVPTPTKIGTTHGGNVKLEFNSGFATVTVTENGYFWVWTSRESVLCPTVGALVDWINADRVICPERWEHRDDRS